MKHSLTIVLAAATLVSSATLANAQTKSASMQTDASMSQNAAASAPLDVKDSAYLREAASGSAYEFQLSELGVERATNPEVRGYATALVLAHASYASSLMNLAHEKNATLPTGPAVADSARLASLAKTTGAAFDRAFLQEEVRVNGEDISKSTSEMSATSDQSLSGFLREYATGDRFHLASAKQLLGQAAAALPSR